MMDKNQFARPEIAEILRELRSLTHAFGDVSPDAPLHFYVHAFHELDLNVRALLDALDAADLSGPV